MPGDSQIKLYKQSLINLKLLLMRIENLVKYKLNVMPKTSLNQNISRKKIDDEHRKGNIKVVRVEFYGKEFMSKKKAC